MIYAVCHTCKLKHVAKPGTGEAAEFFARHADHKTDLIEPDPVLAKLRRLFSVDTFRRIGDIYTMDRMGYAGYRENASVKQAFGTATAFTKTNANLTNSATAGWQSNAIDNSSNLYIDALVSWELAAVNTAPGSMVAIFCYAFGLIEGSVYTSTGDATPGGSEGTLAYPSVSTSVVVAPLLGVIPYPLQNKAINGGPFSMAACFGGNLPPKWSVGMVNFSGMTLNVTNIYYIEKYLTVV